MLSKIIQHHGRANQRLASLEEDLAHAKLEEEKLKATIETLEKEKNDECQNVDIVNNNDERRFALLEVNKALKMWRADNVIVGVSFVRGHCTFQHEPLAKGLDADDFSVDKFFGLQDPTTLDDAQASPDFEEDLRTNERVRLRAEVRNLEAEPQWVTRSTHIRLEYEPTILHDVAPTDNPAHPVTLDLTVDAREDPSSLP
ncbi:hypothetical protein R1flu_023759 [Riccia fluitans]|uniref:Uncharacterized protein n=1 Tax=Riccia fluitans TaxID=41844 RepID=A0ABD1XSY4_9MARC